jgi:glycosyltransferase 2 family protein
MRTHLRTILVVGLAVGLLAWFLRNADLAGVGRAIAHGRLSLLAAALVATIATYVLRSIRWQFLLRGVAHVGLANAFEATVIGFAASFLLPGRVGEFLRPYVLARREKFSVTAGFATVILERVFDAVTVLSFFAVFLLAIGPSAGHADPVVWRAVKVGGLGVALSMGAVLVLFFFLAGHPEKLGRALLRIEKVLPAPVAHKIAGLVQTFAEGLVVIRRPQQVLLVLLWSVPLWTSIAAGIWFTTRAFYIECPFVGSFLTMTILVVGVAVPTPGAVGGFHEAYRIAVTSFFGAPNDAAVAAAIVLHAISFVPVTIMGIVFMAREGLTLGRVRRLAEGADAGEAGR